MTFSVVAVNDGGAELPERVIGTVWADEKSLAEQIVASVCEPPCHEAIELRLSSGRELPLSVPQ